MNVVEDVQDRIRKRISELEPLVAEYEQLREMERTLQSPSGGASQRTRTRRGGRAATSRTRSRSKQGGARTKRTTRADEAVALISANPGITVPDLAKKMGIDPNYLYRVVPRLEKEQRVRREGKAWHPA